MDTKIISKNMGPDAHTHQRFKAYPESDPGSFEEGETEREALGRLLLSHSDKLGIKLVHEEYKKA